MIITQTPLRISFAGGGTDFPDYHNISEGKVISAAIDKYVYVIVKERCDDLIIANYSQREEVNTPADLQHELIREALYMTEITKGVEIHTLADIRSGGSGLGSSSAFTVGILNALYTFKGIHASQEMLADKACQIEINICEKPIGKQDQYIAAYGGLKVFRFYQHIVEITRLDLKNRMELNRNLMLFYLGVSRKDDRIILSRQRENIPSRLDALRQLYLYAGSLEKLFSNRDVTDFTFVGDTLRETWPLKKTLAEGISDERIDEIYEKALSAGAIGGKVCGAGGGGHLLLYCSPDKQTAVREALKDLSEVHFSISRYGSRVTFNNL